MAGKAIRERGFQGAPFFAILMPEGEFLHDKAGIGVEEGNCEVCPHRLAAEIRHVHVLPRSLQSLTIESGARVVEATWDASVGHFDRDRVGRPDKAFIFADAIRGQLLTAKFGLHTYFLQDVRPTLHVPEGSRNRHIRLQALQLTPAIQSTVSPYSYIQKLVHENRK